MPRPTSTNKDYARRPELIGDLGHVEWMKRPTFRALQRIRERKESEFKKPYREDDHVPMEHWADYPFPVFTFPPFPNFPGPVPEDPGSPWILHPGEEEEEIWEGVCPPVCICDPGNPTTITAGGNAVVMNVIACPPPNSVSISIHESNYFKIKTAPVFIKGSDSQWAFSILAEADACGLCTIVVSCSDGSGTTCYLRCATGQWTLDDACTRTGSGVGCPPGSCACESSDTLIKGDEKWFFSNETCEKAPEASWTAYSIYNCLITPWCGNPNECCGTDDPCATSGGDPCDCLWTLAYHYTWEC